jgi:putative tricarboxylic transport membrane protein
MKRLASSADLRAGLFFLAVAALGLYLAQNLRPGTAMRMGPGYLPNLVCFCLLALGAATVAKAVATPGPDAGRWYLRPLMAVLGALLVFALGIELLGLFATTALVVVVASFATPESRPIEVLIVALSLAAFSTALFVQALSLPIPAWPQLGAS